MRSLRLRLFTLLLALAALAALAVGGATYVSVRAEADELFDYHLRQMALSLRDQGRISDDERDALANPEFDYVVQIWSVDGVALYSSRRQPPVGSRCRRARCSASATCEWRGTTWRVFGAATPQRVVQVAQPLAVRRRLATAAAARSVLPIVAAAPLVALAMWWLVGFSLAPLQRVVAAARTRDARSLDPLPADRPAGRDCSRWCRPSTTLLARLATAFDAPARLRRRRGARTAHAAHRAEAATGPAAQRRRRRAARGRAGAHARRHRPRRAPGGAVAGAGARRARSRRRWPTLDLVAVARQALADAASLAAARQASVRAATRPNRCRCKATRRRCAACCAT